MNRVMDLAILIAIIAIGMAGFAFGELMGQKTGFDNCMDYYYDQPLKDLRPLCDNIVYKGTTK